MRLCQLIGGSLALSVATLMPPAAQAQPGAAASTCGRISVFDVAPRNQDLYRARLINLDGQSPGPSGSRSFRVARVSRSKR